ncbi:pseudaminic acid synthase [Prochlorococcus marinus]|uniref:pseudaminic acid synthase n=1 Tax=Prochlorococcus marinus TaxID=1219 RepID=UPI001ADB3324|nr:pseudaminic acid synthase [Prochlorococcus marinus]MBO8217654.1 pseudaminic acid synthase [Prochlorococcus marinus XMU1405]MBW3040816.1 pseudaminic acid synthase [Prochlorococcus marinus str. MU1405]MBW3048275.1 pseudaminic acid synthase [Prochlorococcus marinus str. MU1406]
MFEVNKVKIGQQFKPYIIAELSANHGGDIRRAKDSILVAKKSGVDAVKIQTYTPDTMTIDSNKVDFIINDGLWKGYNLYQLYKEAYTPYEWHKDLFEFARKIKLTIFSTPFDESAVDLLEELNTPAYKIASFEITDLPLIKYTAQKLKPMFISTGMSNADEIADAVETCLKVGNKDILLFHCISNYPAELTDSNLGDIKYLANHFGVEVGLSDHTTSNMAAILSVALGARAIEKHFKLDNDDCGPDSTFSILPNQLEDLCKESELAFKATISNNLKRPLSENINKKFRRSIYFVNDLKKGDILRKNDIRRIRPGFGLDPKFFDELIGKTLRSDVFRGDPVSWNVLN